MRSGATTCASEFTTRTPTLSSQHTRLLLHSHMSSMQLAFVAGVVRFIASCSAHTVVPATCGAPLQRLCEPRTKSCDREAAWPPAGRPAARPTDQLSVHANYKSSRVCPDNAPAFPSPARPIPLLSTPRACHIPVGGPAGMRGPARALHTRGSHARPTPAQSARARSLRAQPTRPARAHARVRARVMCHPWCMLTMHPLTESHSNRSQLPLPASAWVSMRCALEHARARELI